MFLMEVTPELHLKDGLELGERGLWFVKNMEAGRDLQAGEAKGAGETLWDSQLDQWAGWPRSWGDLLKVMESQWKLQTVEHYQLVL